MELLSADRYCALNDRTIHLLIKGDIDMSATTAEFGEAPASNTVSDADVQDWIEDGTEIETFVTCKNKTRAGGAFFPYI